MQSGTFLYNMCLTKSIDNEWHLLSVHHTAKATAQKWRINKESYQTACSVKETKLVGESWRLQYKLNNVMMPGLMDMGAQVFIIERRVFEERFPNTKIKSAEDLLVDVDNFRVQ